MCEWVDALDESTWLLFIGAIACLLACARD